MPKIGNYEKCNRFDILGYVACVKKYLCPKCVSVLLNVTEAEARHELKCNMESVANVS